ncbi:unnamed protein product [Blepharisma stoltei]|uniref:Phospholipase n=1 Tax=Blepharisma stoltei TaxID=1481888 RepID=A0AAU9JZF5_9CILI|nr:unnamed protein product [Blepharisma stoltei]
MEILKANTRNVLKDHSLNYEIKEYSLNYYTVDGHKFKLFTFILQVKIEIREYTWKINKSYSDFLRMSKSLETEHGVKKLEITTPLLKPRKFNKLRNLDQLEICYSFLKQIISDQNYKDSRSATEFLEVSLKSFSSDEKCKEGYVLKMGSGRVSNQHKFFTCYNSGTRVTKRWFRVCELGVETYNDNFEQGIADAIYFSSDFQVRVGKKETGYDDAVRISTPQHNIVFRTGNMQKRDEWAEAINNGYDSSEYKNAKMRYDSSFLVRNYIQAKWYIDGAEYFSDICNAIDQAQESVFITDWWMSPDVFLKRPADLNPESKLVDVLGAAADRGVIVYVHLYKEISFSLTLNSLYTKNSLSDRSPNIKVMRHPNVSLKGGTFLWSHHEKLVCIDSNIAFMGGLDLCHGRWDTGVHSLTDLGEHQYWNGIEYSNVRIEDFTKVEDWERDTIDRETTPRMPWHDIAICVTGMVVDDITRHFRELWNHSVKDVTGSRESGEIMTFVEDNKATAKVSPKIETILSKNTFETQPEQEESKDKNKFSKLFSGLISKAIKNDGEDEESASSANEMHHRFLERASMEPEKDVEKIEENKEEDEENKENGENKEGSSKSYLTLFSELIKRNLNPHPNAKRLSEVSLEEEKDEIKKREEDEERKKAEENNYKGDLAKTIFSSLLISPKKPPTKEVYEFGTCRCQLTRSGGLWSLGIKPTEVSIHSAYMHLINSAENFIYIENQFFISSPAGDTVLNLIGEALISRILNAIKKGTPFKVIVVIPLLPAFEGSVDDPAASVLRVQLYWEYQTICRGANSIYTQLKEKVPNPEDYISFYSLRTHAVLNDWPVTEMIYIHSKLMIVDDQHMIVGSANLNDRSLNGNRDSEIAMVITDNKKVSSRMAGENVEVSEFCHSLRMNIFKEHSGCDDFEILKDPFTEEFEEIWKNNAKKNTEWYRRVFRCYPDDNISKIKDVEEFAKESDFDSYPQLAEEVSGHLVEFPLNFLSEEYLKIKVANKEYLLPEKAFL